MTNDTASHDTQPIDQLRFEDAMRALESVVQRLESGDVPLDQAVSLYERGVALRKHCEKHLVNAEQRIEKLALGANGIQAENLDPQA